MDWVMPKIYCEKWPQGCQFCDLILCDGKKESATIKITQRDFHTCSHGCEESVCLRQHEKYGNCNMYSAKPATNADRIRAMTDEELAELMEDKGDCPPIECPHDGEGAKVTRLDCKACWLDWLKKEVDADG